MLPKDRCSRDRSRSTFPLLAQTSIIDEGRTVRRFLGAGSVSCDRALVSVRVAALGQRRTPGPTPIGDNGRGARGDIPVDDSDIPPIIERLRLQTITTMLAGELTGMAALGDETLLRRPKLGLYCSRNCPEDLKLKGLDLMRSLRAAGVTVISGFHGPVGRECLKTLSTGLQPIIMCPARSLEGMRVPKSCLRPIAKGRLLLLSMFAGHCQQADRSLVLLRNAFVAGLAEVLLFIHAAPGSRTETMLPKLGFIGKPTFCLDSPSNSGIVEHGARPIAADFTDWFVGLSGGEGTSAEMSDK